MAAAVHDQDLSGTAGTRRSHSFFCGHGSPLMEVGMPADPLSRGDCVCSSVWMKSSRSREKFATRLRPVPPEPGSSETARKSRSIEGGAIEVGVRHCRVHGIPFVDTPSFSRGRKRNSCEAGQWAGMRRQGGSQCRDPQVWSSRVAPLVCERDREPGEAGLQVPLLSERCAGGRAVAHVRMRAEGLQPGARRPQRGVGEAGRRPRSWRSSTRCRRCRCSRLRHLQSAFTHLFVKRAKYPRFKSRKKSRKSAEYTSSAFRYRDGKLTLAKMSGPLDIVWSRSPKECGRPR